MSYKLIGPDGAVLENTERGLFGGHRKLKIYGRLNCPSAVKWLEKGKYADCRVFFKDEVSAIAAGYRPCSICMKESYSVWLLQRKGIGSDVEIINKFNNNDKKVILSIKGENFQYDLKWSSLKRYWQYASQSNVEYLTAEIFWPYIQLCITTASGQGGVVALWG